MTTTWQFDLCGGHLAIDFSNTVSARHTDSPIERICNYDDVVEFARQSDLLSSSAARQLTARAARHPDLAQQVYTDARELRDALYRIFAGVVDDRAPAKPDLQILNRQATRFHLDAQFDWIWQPGPEQLDEMMGPIVRTAVDLLVGGPRERIRICEADDCLWVFLDTSKNRSRRWCDMAQCGNRAKARRFSARARKQV